LYRRAKRDGAGSAHPPEFRGLWAVPVRCVAVYSYLKHFSNPKFTTFKIAFSGQLKKLQIKFFALCSSVLAVITECLPLSEDSDNLNL
jgi:hypothetical protein